MKTDKSWVTVGGSHAGTSLGRDEEMTCGGGGSALDVCDYTTAFWGWPC